MDTDKPQTFQVATRGQLSFHETMEEVSKMTQKIGNPLDKISFNAPNGNRIRLVHQGEGLFTITFWNGMTYEPIRVE